MTEDEVKKAFEGKPVSSNAPKGYWDTVLNLPEGTKISECEFGVEVLFIG
jgi:hypothetical protein